MNEDTLTGHWKEMRGSLKSWWGNLTDDDFEWIGGQKDRLVGLIQQKYGYSREQAENEVDRKMSDYDNRYGSTVRDASSKLYDIGQNVADKARSTITNKMDQASAYWQEKEFRGMADDVVGLIRRYPIPALLLALGLGYAFAKSVFGRDVD